MHKNSNSRVQGGCSPNQLIVGIPFYGHSYTLADTSAVTPGSPSNGAGNGNWNGTNAQGILAYYEICVFVSYGGWTRDFNDENKCPYAYSGDQWVGYDDDVSIKEKMDFIRNGGFGGCKKFFMPPKFD